MQETMPHLTMVLNPLNKIHILLLLSMISPLDLAIIVLLEQ